MKYALIAPNSIVSNSDVRVAQVEDTTFEVGPPFYWVQCSDNIVADVWSYNEATQQFNEVIVQTPAATQPQPVVSGAQTL